MVDMLILAAVDHGFDPWSDQTKDYKIGICSTSIKHTALKDAIRIMCSSGTSCIPIENPAEHVGLVQSIKHLTKF